jgi:hypothetical protein
MTARQLNPVGGKPIADEPYEYALGGVVILEYSKQDSAHVFPLAARSRQCSVPGQ